LNEVEIAVIDRILSHDYMTVQFLLKILLEFSVPETLRTKYADSFVHHQGLDPPLVYLINSFSSSFLIRTFVFLFHRYIAYCIVTVFRIFPNFSGDLGLIEPPLILFLKQIAMNTSK